MPRTPRCAPRVDVGAAGDSPWPGGPAPAASETTLINQRLRPPRWDPAQPRLPAATPEPKRGSVCPPPSKAPPSLTPIGGDAGGAAVAGGHGSRQPTEPAQAPPFPSAGPLTPVLGGVQPWVAPPVLTQGPPRPHGRPRCLRWPWKVRLSGRGRGDSGRGGHRGVGGPGSPGRGLQQRAGCGVIGGVPRPPTDCGSHCPPLVVGSWGVSGVHGGGSWGSTGGFRGFLSSAGQDQAPEGQHAATGGAQGVCVSMGGAQGQRGG